MGAIGGFKHTRATVKLALLVSGVPADAAEKMLSPKDDQNVPEAVKLLN